MIAVNVGVIMAALLFMKRMAESVRIEGINSEEIATLLPDYCVIGIPKGVQIYSIDGPFFFGAAEAFENTMMELNGDIRVLIIRLARVPFVDATAMQTFHEMITLFQKRHKRIIICEANERVTRKLAQARILDQLGAENVYPDLLAALNAAESTRAD